MIHSVVVVYIVLGNSQTVSNIEEKPEIGLFSVYNVITQYNEWALCYSTDKIHGKDAEKIRVTQGFIPPDGIGTINERANFKLGGGQVLQSGTRFKLRNTNGLKTAVDEMGIGFAGRQVYVIEYTWNEPVNEWEIVQAEIDVNPLFAGRIDAPRWGESIVEFQALPTFEAQRITNISIDEKPVTFGALSHGFHKRTGQVVNIPQYVFTGKSNNKDDINYDVVNGGITKDPLQDSTHQIFYYVDVELKDIWDDTGITDRANEYMMAFKMHELGTDDIFVVDLNSGEGVPVFAGATAPWNTNIHISPYVRSEQGTDIVRIHIVRPFTKGTPLAIRLVRGNVFFESDGWWNRPQGRDGNLDSKFMKDLYHVKDGRILPIHHDGKVEDFHFEYRGHLRDDDGYFSWNAFDLTNRKLGLFLNHIESIDINNTLSQEKPIYRGGYVDIKSSDDLKFWGTKRGELLGLWNIRPGYYSNAKSDRFSVFTQYTDLFWEDTLSTGSIAYAAFKSILPKPESTVGERAYLIIKAKIAMYPQPDAAHIRLLVRDGRSVTEIAPGRYLKVPNIGNQQQQFDNNYAIIQNYDSFDYPVPDQRQSGVYGTYDAFWQNYLTENDINLSGIWENPENVWMGYKNFEISELDFGNGRDKEFLFLCRLGVRAWFSGDGITAEIMYEDDVDISDGILAHTTGRIYFKDLPKRISRAPRYQNGFGKQIVEDNVNNPVVIIEHVLRLSNWLETQNQLVDIENPEYRFFPWGKKYVPAGYTELIDTDSFDSCALEEQRNIVISGQIINPSDAVNYDIAKSIAKDFYIGLKNRLPKDYSVNGKSHKAWIGEITMPHETVFSLETPSLTQNIYTDDRDGQKYRIVKIGGLEWFAENFNYVTNESRCYEDKPANCAKYGKLYTWDEAMNACPDGWRLPSERDFDDLIVSVGASSVVATKLKSQTGWNAGSDYIPGADEFGFSALPGGFYGNGGIYGIGIGFHSAGSSGYWWSATEGDTDNAKPYIMHYNHSNLLFGIYEKEEYRFSVRYVRDYVDDGQVIETSYAHIIGLRELLDPVEIREPSVYDIYCEPVLKYGYVEGIGYTQEMAITSINMPEYRAEYTRGLSPAHSREIWEYCKYIFDRFQAFGEMPADLTEQRWICDNGTLLGVSTSPYKNALWKLRKILDWMQKPRTTIKVGWETGRTWEVGTHIRISVPHIKGGNPFLCVVESIAKTRYGSTPNVSCDLIVLEPINQFDIDEDRDDYIIIDESGDRDTAIDESGSRGNHILEDRPW